MDETKLTCLSIKEDLHKHHFGYVCSKKGRDGDVSKVICKDVANNGFANKTVIFKSDQDHAIEDLLKEVRETRKEGST